MATIEGQSREFLPKVPKYGMHDLRRWMRLCESEPAILPIDVAEYRAADIYTDLGTCERVVWDKETVIETGDLAEVGLGPNVNGVYGLHVTSDVEFWFTQLVRDYDRDPLAYVIEINCLDTDVLVEDNQIMDRDAVSADSHVLLTTRRHLTLGQDFRYVRTLTEADLEEEDHYEDNDDEGPS